MWQVLLDLGQSGNSSRGTFRRHMAQAHNVVLFGETGVGKSSIINIIVGAPEAKTSNDIRGCTDKNISYSVTLDGGVKIKLWDTIGLDEGTAGTLPAEEAKQSLKRFLQHQIASSDGVDLLLYCIRGASGAKSLPVKPSHWEKYRFVFEEVCKKRIPVALIITNLESYGPGGDMDKWWDLNEAKLSDFGFQLCAHACVTALPPKVVGSDHVNQVDASRHKLRELLSRNYLAPRNVLLLGDSEDRTDFIDMALSCNKQNSNHTIKEVPSLACTPIAFDVHTHVNLWNTSGFDETDDDALVTDKNLKLITQGIRKTAGIHLLLFCFRMGRLKVRHTRNYYLFRAAICRKKVPTAIVILGPMEEVDTWWQRNEQDFRQKGFYFERHVCIPCDPCQHPIGDLDDDSRHQLIRLMQEEHTLGSWKIEDDPFWVTVPNVRAVIGELSWPTTTVIVCDTTQQQAFLHIIPSVQSSLRRASDLRREHRFQQIDPQNFLLIPNQSSDAIHLGTSDQHNKAISLIMFFMSAEDPDSDTWGTLEKFYFSYKGSVTPLIVVVFGAPERRVAEDFWKTAPRQIRRQMGAYLTYHPGITACTRAQEIAQEIMANMIRDQCLVDLAERVGILQEILSVWKRYRSRRNKGSD